MDFYNVNMYECKHDKTCTIGLSVHLYFLSPFHVPGKSTSFLYTGNKFFEYFDGNILTTYKHRPYLMNMQTPLQYYHVAFHPMLLETTEVREVERKSE